MSVYRDEVLPLVVEVALAGKEFDRIRARVVEGLGGEVLEVGFGSGRTLHFAEHGRSPDPAVVRWQDRLTPLQRKAFGGCHLNRPIDQLVSASGLELTRLANYYVRGPKTFGYTFEGVATKA